MEQPVKDDILSRIYPEEIIKKGGKVIFEFVEGSVTQEELEYVKNRFAENDIMKDKFEVKTVKYTGEYVRFRIDTSKNCPTCHKRSKNCKGHV